MSPAPAGAAPPEEPAAGQKACRVVFTLTRRPLSRVWCQLTSDPFSAEHPSSYSIEFDPTASANLSASASLAVGPEWKVTCLQEPHPETARVGELTATVDTSWLFASAPGTLKLDDSCKLEGADEILTADVMSPSKVEVDEIVKVGVTPAGDEKKKIQVKLLATPRKLPDLATAASALATAKGGVFGGRSLDSTVPSVVQDTLTLLAEIAIERAKSRAFTLIHQKLTHFVCEDLKIPAGSKLPWEPEQPLLPATCDAVRAISLAQLAEAAPLLTRALDHDLLMLALNGVARSAAGRPSLLVASLLSHDPAATAIDGLSFKGAVCGGCKILQERRAQLRDALGAEGWSANTVEEKAGLLKQLATYPSPVDADAVPEAWRTQFVEARQALSTLDTALTNACPAGAQAATELLPNAVSRFDQASRDLSAFRRRLVLETNDPDFSFIVAQVEAVAAGAIESGRAPTPRMMQGLLVTLAQHPWTLAGGTGKKTCAIQLAFAAMASCHAMGAACDARAVGDLLRHPENHFSDPKCVSSALPQIEEFPWLPSIVTRGLDVLDPPPGMPPEQQVDAAITVTFDLMRVAFRSTNPEAVDLIDQLQRVTLAALDGNPQSALQAGGALVRQAICNAEPAACREDGSASESGKVVLAIERVMPVVTALAANNASLKQAQASPDQAKALREARKQTLESLIEASTDRSHRAGDWLLSLGTMVGPYVTVGGGARPNLLDSKWSDRGDNLSLGLPMGIAYQHLSEPGFDLAPRHFMLSAIDLGNLLQTSSDQLQWNDFVALGAQVGWTYAPTPGDLFSLGLDVHYFPAGRLQGHARVMVFLGYYVPFFDLN